MWLAYARDWEGILARWDEGDFSAYRPKSGFPIGILFFRIEGQTVVGLASSS